MKLTLLGVPRTKKNHTVRTKTGKQIQSKAYRQYEKDCLWQIPAKCKKSLSGRYNLKALFFMDKDYYNNKAVVDLTNLLQATCDILVKGRVIEDDNCRIIAGYDGSRVLHDKLNPRVEIELEEL